MREASTIRERLKYYSDFLWGMTEKEIKARYKRAVFGFLWILLNPLMQMIIIGAIFSYFIKVPNYFLFLFVGLLAWQFFSLSLTKVTPSIVYERNLLVKAKFPIEAIPISIILSNFLHMIISYILFLPVKLTMASLLLTITALIWLLLLTIGLGLLTASLNVRYRDVNFFIQTTIILWFYATPILYDSTIVSEKLFPFFALNPLTSIFEILHYSLLNQGRIDIKILAANLSLSLIIIMLGVLIFRKMHKFFVDWL